jgi:uncharacterized protein (TIGR00369 family)
MADDHFRKLERMYASAPVNERYGPELTIREGEAELTLPIDERDHHALGAVHGAVYFKALDDAAFFAANSVVEDVFVLTTGFDVHIERPVSEGAIHAEGHVVNDNPNQLIAEAVARDDDGHELARGTGRFALSDVELSPEIGYE